MHDVTIQSSRGVRILILNHSCQDRCTVCHLCAPSVGWVGFETLKDFACSLGHKGPFESKNLCWSAPDLQGYSCSRLFSSLSVQFQQGVMLHKSRRGRGRSFALQLSLGKVRPSCPMQCRGRLRKPLPQVLEQSDHSPSNQDGQACRAQGCDTTGRSSSGQSFDWRPYASRQMTSRFWIPPPQVFEQGPHSRRAHSASPASLITLMDGRFDPLGRGAK